MERKYGRKSSGKSGLRIPELRFGSRLFLYLVALLCIALSLFQVVTDFLPDMVGIACYVLAATTLFFSVCYLTLHVRRSVREVIRPFIMGNTYTRRVVTEYRLRTILFTVPGTFVNILFAIFNAVLGIISHSAWSGTMAAYYILLSIMRVGAVNKERRISRMSDSDAREKEELRVYRRNSLLFIFMAFVLGGAVILLEASQGGKVYPGFTIYAMAAFSFYKIILSTINMIKVRKQNSMLLAIIRRIGYIDACVSILTLQTAMFNAFSDGEKYFVRLMNGITGAIVCQMVLSLGIYGLVVAKRKKERQEKRYD